MPRRMLPSDFGTSLYERGLTDLALLSYPWMCRAFCYYGGAENMPSVIQVKAFEGRPTPNAEQVQGILKEYETAALVERFKGLGNIEYLFLTKWFIDNSFMKNTVPSIPRPPSLARRITQREWESGERKYFAKLGGKFAKKKQTGAAEVEEEAQVEAKDIDAVFDYYREKIQPKLQDLPKHKREIGKALARWAVAELKVAIDNREHDEFFWENNAARGAGWFFGDLARVERFINMKPAPKKQGGKNRMADTVEDKL